MRDAKIVKAPHESRMRAVAVAAVYGAGMHIDTESNSKRRGCRTRRCRTWRLGCATVPPGEGTETGVQGAGAKGVGCVRAPGVEVGVRAGDCGVQGAGAKGAGCARAPGVEVGVRADDCGAGTRAFVTATAATRRCARLRSVLRWLTRRLEVPERAVGRGAAAVVGGTQS